VARAATEADFHGTRLNNPSRLYDEYRRYPFFAERAAFIRQRYPTASRVLIAGCGYGYLVDELRKSGVGAWGCDIAPWATGQAAQVLGQNAQFVGQGDITSAASMATVKSQAGLRNNQRFDVTVTEDVLTVLTEAEITAALQAVRGISSTVLHMVTPGVPNAEHHPDLNWKSIAAWRSRCAPDVVYDVEQRTV